MIGECRTHKKGWSWLALVWLGILLMLGALSLPGRAAMGGFVAPATPDAPGSGDAAARVRTTLAAQGYVVTNAGLSGDGVMAGVIMRPASQALDAAAPGPGRTGWQQVRAGWQALAEAYPQATWLLSGYGAGERYLICFLLPARSPSLSAGHVGVYDTLLGRWVQHKDFARKDFGVSAPGGISLSPLSTLTPAPEPSAAVPHASPNDLSDQPAASCFLPSLDQVANHIAMRVEDRRRWSPETAPTVHWQVVPPSSSGIATSSPDLLCQSRAPAPHREPRTEAHWRARTYPADSEAQDASEDPAGDPPPTARPLLSPRPASNTFTSLQASFSLSTPPDPTIHRRTNIDITSPAPQHLLAWPALRVRPPPRLARPQRVFRDTASVYRAARDT